MSTQIVSNLDHICRVCLTESDKLVSLFSSKIDDVYSSLADILRYHARIEIYQEDGLPPNICIACLKFVSECVQFLNKCKSSDKLLRNIEVTVIKDDSQQLIDDDLIENTEIESTNNTEEQVQDECLDLMKYDDIIEEIVFYKKNDESNIEPDYIGLSENVSNDQDFVWLEVQNNIIAETNNLTPENEIIADAAVNQDVNEIIVNTYYDQVNLITNKLGGHDALDVNVSESSSSNDRNNYLENSMSVDNCENKYENEESDMIVVPAEENIDGCEVYKIYTSDYQLYLGQYFYVGNGQIPPKSKRRNYAYYEKVSDDTSLQIEESKVVDYPDLISVFNCKFCIKEFNSKSALLRHMRTHTGEKPYLCAECGKQFGTLASLDLHQRIHSGEKRYECNHCGRKFLDNSNLRKHLQLHTGEKPFYCDQCGRNFGRKYLLELHMRIHTGEKPYECESCGRKFRQQGDFAAHKRIHSGERPHKCSLCGKGFIKSSAMQLHMKSHLRNQC